MIIASALFLTGISFAACDQSGKNKKENFEDVSDDGSNDDIHDAQSADKADAGEPSGAVAADNELVDDNFFSPDTKVTNLTVFDFNATWCGPCKAFKPAFDEIAERYGSKARFVSVDIDKCPNTAEAFKITAVPTVILMKPDGGLLRFEGTGDLLPGSKFEKLVKDNL